MIEVQKWPFFKKPTVTYKNVAGVTAELLWRLKYLFFTREK